MTKARKPRYRVRQAWAVKTNQHWEPSAIFLHRGDAIADKAVMADCYEDDPSVRWWVERCEVSLLNAQPQRKGKT